MVLPNLIHVRDAEPVIGKERISDKVFKGGYKLLSVGIIPVGNRQGCSWFVSMADPKRYSSYPSEAFNQTG